jgi:hypothetical protein
MHRRQNHTLEQLEQHSSSASALWRRESMKWQAWEPRMSHCPQLFQTIR